MIENTTKRDPLVHLVGSMGEGTDSYITGMESAGQQQLVHSDVLPTDGPWDDLEALGFTRGEQVNGDDLFARCTLPDGWRKEGSDHAMWSYVIDERGIRRVAVFYKAAFYDRRAFCRLTNVGGELASELIYEVRGKVEQAVLPSSWDALTEVERADFWKAVESRQADIERHPDIYGEDAPTVTALLALRQ